MKLHNEVDTWLVGDLCPHPKNRLYNSALDERELAVLRESISSFGIQEPLWVMTNGTIISGHGRHQVAVELQMERVPVRVVENATEEEIEYLLVLANESRREGERDLMKKARHMQILYAYWGIKQGRPREGENGRKTAEELAKSLGETGRTVRRLLKLLDLIPEFQQMVSEGAIGLVAGNELAALPEEEQAKLFLCFKEKGITEISLKEIKAIRKELDFLRDRSLDDDDPDDHPPRVNPIETSEKEGTTEAQSWHSELGAEAAASALDAVKPMFADGAENVKRRHFLTMIEKHEKTVNRFAEELLPLFDHAISDPAAKEMLSRMADKLHQIVDRMNEVIDS